MIGVPEERSSIILIRDSQKVVFSVLSDKDFIQICDPTSCVWAPVSSLWILWNGKDFGFGLYRRKQELVR